MTKKYKFWFSILWGTAGVIGLLAFSISRLLPIAWQMADYPNQWWHWLALVLWMLFMAYTEGYKGFQQAFSPRVAARLLWLAHNPKLGLVLVAPLYAMGFVYATSKRMAISFGIVAMVVVFVLIAEILPAPWRAIVDAGVILGLFWGAVTTLVAVLTSLQTNHMMVDPELPVRVPNSVRY